MDKLLYLSQINLLNSMEKDALMEIERITTMNSVKKGKIIFSPHQSIEGLFLLKKGQVRLYRINPEGKEFTVGLLGAGNIFGEIESFSTGTNDTYVEAISDTLLCLLKKEDFEKFIKERPEIALKMIKLLSERLREAQDMLEKLALSDVRSRITYLLLKLADTFGQPQGDFQRIDAPLTHQDLANMVGSTRETVSSILAIMVKENLILTGRKELLVNRDRLENSFEVKP